MSDRHQRVESLIRELAAKFILEEANSDPMITVTHVSTSPDYKRVTVFVTTIPSDKEAESLIFLKRYAGTFRKFIGRHAKLKAIPHIDFEIDYGERHRQHIDTIAQEIDKDKIN